MPDSSADQEGTASAPPEHRAVSPLAQGYESVLRATDTLPFFVAVPSTHRRRGFRRHVNSLPRPKLGLRFFVVDHARRVLELERRRLLAAAALGDEPASREGRRDSVGLYLESLPKHQRAIFSSSLLITTVLVTQFVLAFVSDAPRLFGDVGMDELPFIEQLLSSISAATSSLSSIDNLFVAVSRAPFRALAFVMTSLCTALYLELRPLLPGYRLKRAIFNLYPHVGEVTSTPARWSVQRASGLYDVERAVMRDLKARPPRELPFDLVVPALLMPSVLFLGAIGIEAAQTSIRPEDPWFTYTMATGVIIAALARLFWLARAWHRRTRASSAPHLPSEVRIRDSHLVVALRDPDTILWTTAIAGAMSIALSFTTDNVAPPLSNARFLVLLFVIAPLWLRMNRDLSAYLRLRDDPRPGRPEVSFLAMASGWIGFTPGSAVHLVVAALTTGWVLVSVYNTGKRIQRAQSLAGVQRHRVGPPWLLVLGFPVFPLTLAHMQRAINATWQTDGELLD